MLWPPRTSGVHGVDSEIYQDTLGLHMTVESVKLGKGSFSAGGTDSLAPKYIFEQ